MTDQSYPAPAVGPVVRVVEDDMHKYARHSRNANVFVAWVVGIGVAFSIIAGIIIAVGISHLNNGGGTPTVSSTCYSQGGFDTTC